MRRRPGSRRNIIILSIIIVVLGVLLLLLSPSILYLLGRLWTVWHPVCCGECLSIYNNSYIDTSRGILVLFLSNCGEINVTIFKVELDDVNVATYHHPAYLILRPGEEIKLELQLSGIEIEYGRRHLVKIYTVAGNLYRASVEPR